VTNSAITRREALHLGAAGLGWSGVVGAVGTTVAAATVAAATTPAATAAAAAATDQRLLAQFADPLWNRETSARLEGDIAPNRQVFGSAFGVLNAVLRFDVFSTTRVLRQSDGSYQRLSREVVFYRDVETRKILDTWTNPYTNEQVKVVDIANDPFNYKISEFFPDPPSYGGLNKDKPPRRPFILDWALAGEDTVTLDSDINLFYPSALQPDKWPRESPGKMSQVSEFFRYVIRREDLEDPRRTHLPYVGTWVRITPWLPWMLMDQRQGHMVYVGTMTSRSTPDGVPADVLARVKERYPQYLTAPDKWEEPSLSSLEHYAREQRPAPPRTP
jgi:hypothetical protein